MKKPTRILPALLLLPVAGAFAQVTVPYTNDFTSSVADFSTVGSWTLDTTGGGTYTSEITSDGTRDTAAISATDFADGDFTVSTTFSATGFDTGLALDNFGLILFGGSASDPVNPNSVFFDYSDDNILRIINVGSLGNGSVINQTKDLSGGPLELTSGTEYTLSVDGTYSGNDLDLVLELSDGTNSDSVSGTIANFATSTDFGDDVVSLAVRWGTGSGSGNLTTTFSEISVIPEPGSIALAGGLFALAIAALRRRA